LQNEIEKNHSYSYDIIQQTSTKGLKTSKLLTQLGSHNINLTDRYRRKCWQI